MNLALIPARAGSTGVKNKNLQKVSGMSLVSRTYSQALNSDIFEKIVISTDSLPILHEIFLDFSPNEFKALKADSIIFLEGSTYFHKRSPSDSKVLSPIRNVVFKLSRELDFSKMWLLQPTSPYRLEKEFSDIQKLIGKLKISDLDWSSIVSCKAVGGMHPDRMFRLKADYVESYLTQLQGENAPRQLLEKLYIKDGAFYVLKKENLLDKIFLGQSIVPFVREGLKTLNIDSVEDLYIAQILAENFLEAF